ncbi:MAG: prepilin-type N-terminal cleavage/methylation domain-containing protein [Coriobacteriales bacterium]|jgi:prepilin-type N-terminal cleavage/methylation domain-containing protein|nr:prepilin-type N-terminal cleavage/methylation domain-containing protein [Coriobacteriales bacterium]
MWSRAKYRHSSIHLRGRHGFTLVELIVGIMLAALVIGAAGTFLVFGSNLLSQTAGSSQQQTDVTSVSQSIAKELRLAHSVEVVPVAEDDQLPTTLSAGEKIIFIGDADGEVSTTGRGYYYLWIDDEDWTEPHNNFGLAFYGGYEVALEYRANVLPDDTKNFEVKVTAYRDDGQPTNTTGSTAFELINSPVSEAPLASEFASSTEAPFYLLIKPARQTTALSDYVSFGLSYGFGVSEGNPSLGDNGKYIWENDSGVGNIELTFTENANPIGSTGITFDGNGDYGKSVNTVDLSGADAVTVEVCFRAAAGSNGILFETTKTWNADPAGRGAIGATVNSTGFGYEIGRSHTVGRVGSDYSSSRTGARNFAYTDDPDSFTTFSLVFSKVKDCTGRLAYVNGILKDFYPFQPLNTDGTNNGLPFSTSQATTPATGENSAGQGNFANDFLYLACRNGDGGASLAAAFFKGEIAALRIYDHKLSSYEIARNAAADDARYNQ